MSAPPARLDVFLLPGLTTPAELAGKTVVVIDVLRATTTIIHALAAGARRVIPCLEVDEVRRRAAELSRDGEEQVLLGGERGGLRIDGFDLDNSPHSYSPDRVAGKTILFTTTNGTRAMLQCRQAGQVFVGAFVNLSALCHRLSQRTEIALLCAGTDSEITREDVLFAGAMVDELRRSSHAASVSNDQAEIASDAWRSAQQGFSAGEPLCETLRSCRGGRNLIEIGQERDIEIAAQLDRFEATPELDLTRWEITLLRRKANGVP